MKEFLNWLVQTYLGGICIVFFGYLSIRLAMSNQKQKDALNNSGLKGWMGGIFLILIGMIVIIKKFFGF